MQILRPDRTDLTEDLVYSDLAALLARATGQQPAVRYDRPDERQGPALVVGCPRESPFLREIDHAELRGWENWDPEETVVVSLPEHDPPLLVLSGGSPRAAGQAVYGALEEIFGFGFFLEGDVIPPLADWRPGAVRLRRRPALKERLFTTNAYWAGPWRYCSRLWDEAEWDRLITWLRRKRFTGIVCHHDEGGHLWGQAFLRAFPEAREGRSADGFVMEPEQRTELNSRVFSAARRSGLRVVYKLMYSVLPDGIAASHPELTLHAQSTESVGVCAGDPECPKMMRRFWGAILELHPPEPDQMYVVCPYQHRLPLCDQVADRSLPALDAVRVLRDLDPEARIYLETPCGPDAAANRAEWPEYRRRIPADVGVVDWASGVAGVESGIGADGLGPTWMTTVHVSRAGAYPPVGVTLGSHAMQAEWKAAQAGGATGIIVSNALAATSSVFCDYAAALGWNPDLAPETHLKDYTRRRYGAQIGEGMARAYESMGRALRPELTLPGSVMSGERMLAAAAAEGPVTKAWVGEWVERVSGWLEAACGARAQAMEVLHDDEADVPSRFMRETAYVEWRCLSLLALLRSHRVESPVEAAELVVEAVDRLRALGERYEHPDLSVAGALRTAKERGVRLTSWFLEDPSRLGASHPAADQRPWLFPAREHFTHYERSVLDAAPVHVREAAANLLAARDHGLEEAGAGR